jgi:4-amino-4-deoxy-L-arabinose transferase-like glycosyltransferase
MAPVKAGHSAEPDDVVGRGPRRAWARYLEVSLPYLLALLFFLSALYGVGRTEIVDTDAARHAMNGAFIYDLIRTGHLFHPIEYAKLYYSHLPSLSMPFHPPLFPAVEAVFFALFGLKMFTARLAVAVCVAVSAALLYRLVWATLGSSVLAACITVSTFSFWTFQFVARDVMLEFPAMVFTLAALYCLRDFWDSYPMRRAILFALFAAAAVWTKQHAVFLGAVPFIETVLSRRWRRFLEAPLWVSSFLYGLFVIGLIGFSKLYHGAGVDQLTTTGREIYYIVKLTMPAYFSWIVGDLRGMPGVLLVCAVVAYLLTARWRDDKRPQLTLYTAWILAVLAVLVDLGPVSPRYLFFALPATATIAYAWLFYGCRRFWGERRAEIVAIAFAVAFFVAGLGVPFDFLHGPAVAAQVVVQGTPTRVLYAGDGDGNFIFATRVLDSQLRVTVIPAAKLPRKILESTDLAGLCRRYGIEWVVFENVRTPHPWSGFRDELPVVGKLERSIPLESTRARWRQGSIDVYRFTGAAQHPDDGVPLPVPRI